MKLVTAVVCLLSSMAFAQTGFRYDNRVSTVASNVPSNAQAPVLAIPNASVLICNDGACTSPASIFSNQALTVPITGPLTTDGKGMFGFWAAAGSYFYQVSDFKGNLIGTYPITLGGSGGGSSPVGPQYKIGAFNQSPAGGNAALGASNAFTDATGNPLTVPGALSAQSTDAKANSDMYRTGGTGNDGVANAIAAGQTYIEKPVNSTDTTPLSFPQLNGVTVVSHAGGVETSFATNPPFGQGAGNSKQCWFDSLSAISALNGIVGTACNYTPNQFWYGYGNSEGEGNVYNAVDAYASGNKWDFIPGLQSVGDGELHCYHDDDCHVNYEQIDFGAFNRDIGQEGVQLNPWHMFEFQYVYVGTVASVIDQQHIMVNSTTGTNYGGGFLVDMAAPDIIASGKIIANTAASVSGYPQTVTTATTHTASSAYGLTTTAIPLTSNVQTGSPIAVTITNVAGTFPSSGIACIMGNQWESVHYTAAAASGGSQVINVSDSRFSNPIPSLMVAGPCNVIHDTNDTQTSGGHINSDLFFVSPGAPDSTHYWVTFLGRETGDQPVIGVAGGDHNWQLDQTMTGATFTRDGSNNVTVGTPNIGGVGSITPFNWVGSLTLAATGCADSSFNFSATSTTGSIVLTNFVYSQPGASVSAGSTTGCTLTWSGNNGFEVRPMAQVLSVTDPAVAKGASPVDGYFSLGANTVTWASAAVEQPHANALGVNNSGNLVQNTPSLAGRASSINRVLFSGKGVDGPGFQPINWLNQNPWSMYQGGGGRDLPATLMQFGGVWGTFESQGLPPNGIPWVVLGCAANGCGFNFDSPLFSLPSGNFTQNSSNGQMGWTGAAGFKVSTGYVAGARNGAAGVLQPNDLFSGYNQFNNTVNNCLSLYVVGPAIPEGGVCAGFHFGNISSTDFVVGNPNGTTGMTDAVVILHATYDGSTPTANLIAGTTIGTKSVCLADGTNCPAGGGGATTPATTLLYKGNNTVNGVVAATPGTDYTTPAPTATQQIAQPAGTTFAAIQDNFIIDVEAAPSTCSAAPYGTHSRKIDCAIGYAKTQQSATSSAVLLQLGAGNYITCDGIVQPTSGTGGIMIRGAGMAVTTITADTTGGCAVAGNPLYQHTAGYEILEMSDLTLNPNGIATTCYDTTVTEAFLLANTNCLANGNYGFGQFTATSDGTTGNFTGVTGTFPAVGNFVVPRFAVPGPPLTVTAVNSGAGTITVALPNVAGVTSGNFPAALTGGLYQFTTVDHIAGLGNPAILDFVEDSNYIIHNIISAPYTTNVLYATVSGTLTGSAVTALSCASLCGDYKADTAAQLHVFFNDPTHACTTLPVAHITSVSGGSPNTITGFTIEYGGSCTVMPYVGVAPEVEVPYGIKLALSDSTTTGWYVGAGKIGMYTVGGNTFHEHFHPTSTAVGFEDHGNTHWDSTEFDTLMQLGGMFWGTSPSVVTAANGVTGAHVLPGISSFYFANSSTPMTFHGLEDMFTSTSPTGYNEFTNAAGVVTPCGTGWPALATILQNDKIKAAGIDCLPTLTVQTLTVQNALTLPNGSTATTQTAGDNTTKVATTAFVTGALTSSIQRVASGFCTGVFTSSTTIGIPGFGVALSTAACTGTRAATSGFMMNGSGTLSNLKMRCAATGVNTSSGVLTLNVTHAGTGSTFTPTGLTVTYGTSTANSVQADTTHTFAYSDGDLLTVAITTQATETLSTCNVSVNY